MGKVSIMGLLENLSFFGPLLLLVLMPIGFIASAWVTNRVFDMLGRTTDEVTSVDKAGTFLLLTGLFAAYAYFVCSVFVE
jgi:hypothetical protein